MRRLLAAALAAWMAGPFGAMAAALPPFQPLAPLSPVMPGFSARLHLQKFAATSTPTVCLVGDSTSSLTANQVEVSELLQAALKRRLQQDNPKKTITFVNRAVPSQTWATLNGVANSNLPSSWYFYTNLPWLPYVQGQNCTSVFINMGINDSAGISPPAIRSVLTKIAGWGTAPPAWAASTAYTVGQVITDSNGRLQEVYTAGTSGTTAPSWASSYPGQSTAADGGVTWVLLNNVVYVPLTPDVNEITNKVQNPAPPNNIAPAGALLAAAYQRNLARNGGAFYNIPNLPPIGLIDIGRFQAAAVLGVDPDNQYLSVDPTIPSGTNEQFVAQTRNGTSGYGFTFPNTPYGDFGMTGTFYGRGADMLTAAGSQWWIGLGTSTLNYIQLSQTSGSLTGVVTDGSGGYQTCTGSATANVSGNIAWNIQAKGSRVTLTINGSVVCDADYPRYQGSFAPWMQVNGSSVGSAVIATMSDYAEGLPVRVSPFLGPEAWGGTPLTGGNGNNHSSSIGIASEDAMVLNSFSFSTQ